MPRRLTAEFAGTALLLAAFVGSGIMAERLAGGSVALALLANTIATGAALAALILMFSGVSGAHFNPVVTVSDALIGKTTRNEAGAYIIAQLSGAFLGTGLANVMFELPPLFASTRVRTGAAQWLAEFIATLGLVGVIVATTRTYKSIATTAAGVALWITAAYWFTSSTAFANPAVTLARTMSDTFAGIRPNDAPPFIVAQFAGALFATALFNWLLPKEGR